MDTPLDIALFGGSGATGQEVLAEALARGWRVRGLVRRSGSLQATSPGTREIVGSFESDEAIRATIAGAQAVIIVIGPRPPYQDIFCASASESIVRAATELGVTRLICQTGAMIGDYPANQGRVFQLLAKVFAKKAEATLRDRAAQEAVVRNSGLRWTLVKPPRLTNGPRTDRVRCAPGVRSGLFSSISRKDLARVLVDLCTDDDAIGRTLFVKA